MFGATVWLLANFYENIEVDKNKKPKQWDWKACLKLMKDPALFVEKLQTFKDIVDQNLVPPANVNFVKANFLSLDSFTPEIMANKSKAAEGVCSWVLNIVKYYDVI